MKIVINNDKELVAEVRAALRANDGYCPCKLFHTLYKIITFFTPKIKQINQKERPEGLSFIF